MDAIHAEHQFDGYWPLNSPDMSSELHVQQHTLMRPRDCIRIIALFSNASRCARMRLDSVSRYIEECARCVGAAADHLLADAWGMFLNST